MKRTFLLFILWICNAWSLTLGDTPPSVVLEGKNGGLVDGSAWSSDMIKGKVYVLFYVDPDERDTNNEFSDALKAKNFPSDKYASIAIVNMAATWMPNFLINSKLKKKQKKYPNAIYVKDKKKVLVKKWMLADDSSDILVFNKEGKLIFQNFGKLDSHQVEKVITLIENNLDK